MEGDAGTSRLNPTGPNPDTSDESDARSDQPQDDAPDAEALEADPTLASAADDGMVPVTLESRVTEIGTLELWCNARDGARRWKLELNIREGRPV